VKETYCLICGREMEFDEGEKVLRLCWTCSRIEEREAALFDSYNEEEEE